MVEVKAQLKYLRISPRKARLLADLVRGMGLREAEAQIKYSAKKFALPLLKLLKSAESNARHDFRLEPENLCIKKITVDEGPVLKRYTPRARGRATTIRRRTSHVNVVLSEQQKKTK